jgi:truncated hemoglobin YjbI
MSTKTLYTRLGGYDAVAAVVSDLLPRLQQDPALSHFWERRPEDSLQRSKQLLIDFLCSGAGGPVIYRKHKGRHGRGIDADVTTASRMRLCSSGGPSRPITGELATRVRAALD